MGVSSASDAYDLPPSKFSRYGASGCSRFTGLRTVLADPMPGEPKTQYGWVRDLVEQVAPKEVGRGAICEWL